MSKKKSAKSAKSTKTSDIGILDPEGKNKNPLTNKKYSKEYSKHSKVWTELPAYKSARSIISDIKKYQVLLVVAGTGTGKTVLLPKYALHACDYKCNIAITLPKRPVALSSAQYAALTLDVELGKEIGYKYRGSPRESMSAETKLLYATDGTIVANLISDPLLTKYDIIIIDEAHERKVQIDFLFYLLREVLLKRPEFKLIIMSATISTDIFLEYFKKLKIKQINLESGSNFPIKSIFSETIKEKDDYNKIIKAGFDRLIEILELEKNNKKIGNDIIFFVASQNDTTLVCEMLSEYISKCKNKECEIVKQGDILCAKLYSNLDESYTNYVTSEDEYLKDKKYYRKVILATNIAESSLTVKGLTYVIDSGIELLSSYDPKYRAKLLNKNFISLAQAKQRMGRAGRTKPGVCYHLYSKNSFDNLMKKYPEPAIRKSDITLDILRLISNQTIKTCSKLKDALNNFIEPPNNESVEYAINFLKSTNLIIDDEISSLGNFVIGLGVNTVILGLCFAYSTINSCSYEMAIIVTIMNNCNLNINKLFITPKDKEGKMKLKHIKKNMFHYFGDHLTLLKMHQDYNKVEEKNRSKWCRKHMLNESMLNIKKSKLFNTLKNRRREKNINIEDSLSEKINKLEVEDRVLTSLVLGHRANTALKSSNKNKYFTQTGYSKNLKLSKNSFVGELAIASDIYPRNVFYSELFIINDNAELNFVGIISDEVINILK